MFLQNPIPYTEYPHSLLLQQFILMLIVSIFMFIIALNISYRSITRKSKEIFYLGIAFLFISLSIFIFVFPIFLVLWIDPIPEYVFGIALWDDKYLWWTNFGYIFWGIGHISLYFFTLNIFKQYNKKGLNLYVILNFSFWIWSIYHGIYVFVGGKSSLSIPMAVLYLFLNVWVWFLLFKGSYSVVSRIPMSIQRVGMLLIAMSSFLMIFGLLISIGGILFAPLRVYSWLFNLLNVLLFYLGYMLPIPFRNYLIKKGYPSD